MKKTKNVKPLHAKILRQKLNANKLDFYITDEIKSLTEFVGQERALEALNFGIGIKSPGYNLYAMGPPGIGKRALVTHVLDTYAKKASAPSDWCYIHNFDSPEKPIAFNLPAGMGIQFQQDMKYFLNEVSKDIVAVLESDEYANGIKKIKSHYNKLKSRKTLLKNKISKGTHHSYKECYQEERKLQIKLLTELIQPIIAKIQRKYGKIDEVTRYLVAVQADIIAHIEDFIKQDEKTNMLTFNMENPSLTKYKVNLFVDNSHLTGAPIVFEDAPSYSTLICRVEHISYQGTMSTNFTLIRPGSLHLANGGYLLIEARKLKKNLEAWEALKSALYANQIVLKPIEHTSDLLKPISLEPMQIPLNIKVILLGDRNTYYSLSQRDPDFAELFKVPVDFDEQIERNAKNIRLYARLIGTIVNREKLRHFDASAVAEVIDHSSRLAEDNEKLTTHIRDIENIIIESNYWARLNNKKIVKAADVKLAIDAQIRRMDRAKELYHEDIKREFIIIHTKGTSIGQVNCLSVRRVGNYAYGHPTRVTARVRSGRGKFIDIQREIKMAGPLHTKAGLIISQFLASLFNVDQLYALSASISFEQLYCWTDGDSASVGELVALISALANIPVIQSLAVTGSIDQYGEVQAIGGVNEKIEGFFDICAARGLTGKQGVLIPTINIKNLMLRDDIVAAAKKKLFFIFPIKTISDAVTLLTGINAGERNKAGEFTEGSVYFKVEQRLRTLANKSKK